jgi:hypothetical protein
VFKRCAALEENEFATPVATRTQAPRTAAISDNRTFSAGAFNHGIATAVFDNTSVL